MVAAAVPLAPLRAGAARADEGAGDLFEDSVGGFALRPPPGWTLKEKAVRPPPRLGPPRRPRESPDPSPPRA